MNNRANLREIRTNLLADAGVSGENIGILNHGLVGGSGI